MVMFLARAYIVMWDPSASASCHIIGQTAARYAVADMRAGFNCSMSVVDSQVFCMQAELLNTVAHQAERRPREHNAEDDARRVRPRLGQ